MGFDRPGQPDFEIPVSDTQAYKQFGNAVIVPAIESVARHMKPWLAEQETVQMKQADEESMAVG